jgi:hypothetical protein
MNDHDEAHLFDGPDETEADMRQYHLDTSCDAAQAALHDWAGVTIDTRLIAHALTEDAPHLTLLAAEHGWDDGEVLDKLWAILCVTLLGISYGEQTARHLGNRHALADDVTAAHHRWVAANSHAGAEVNR